jgi:hypothetical protein
MTRDEALLWWATMHGDSEVRMSGWIDANPKPQPEVVRALRSSGSNGYLSITQKSWAKDLPDKEDYVLIRLNGHGKRRLNKLALLAESS